MMRGPVILLILLNFWLATSETGLAQEQAGSPSVQAQSEEAPQAQSDTVTPDEHPGAPSVQEQPDTTSQAPSDAAASQAAPEAVAAQEQAGAASAQSPPSPREDARPYQLTVGVREWISQGRSAHNIGGVPNVVSELTWRGLNVPITQVYVDLVARNRIVGELVVGYGSRGHGTLLDQDWAGNNRTIKVSETLSDVTGASVLTISLTTGVRLFAWNVQENPILGGIDLVIGYQYWRERYEASGVQNLLTGASSFNGVLAITQTNTWNSLRLGARATVPLLSRLSLKGSVYYIPYTAYQSEDIHSLRTDLQQNPSFLSQANGGNGVQLEGSVLVRVWRQLTFEAGYAYWDIKSGSGTIQAFNSDGTVSVATHNEENTRRQGFFFGANWLF